MYLVELRPGKEELYRTGDDLALAIRDGDVDARSRIYHRATAKWISITLHPQYKAIVADQREEAARPARKGWSILPSLTGQSQEAGSVEEATAKGDPLPWKSPWGLGFTSILLVLGIQLAFSGPRPPWAGRSTPVVAWSEKSEQIKPDASDDLMGDEGAELISLASATVHPPTDAPVLPRAPRLRRKALRALLTPPARSAQLGANSVQELLARYEMASDSVLARLEAGMRVARLNRLFASSRLSPGGGVSDTRLSLAGAVNVIRTFRQEQAAVDAAFQDSVTLLARTHHWTPKDERRWYSRSPRAEPAALELAGSNLIADVDSLLGVLGSQAGAYKLRGSAIAFEDPSAGQTYGMLRTRVKERIDEAIAAGGSTSSGPAGLLLRAIGTSSLPRET